MNSADSKGVNKRKSKSGLTVGEAVVIVLVFAVVIGLWMWLGVNSPNLLCASDDQATRGQFGDQFGAVNSLFSGLAFAAIFVTLYIQWKQLGDARSQQTKAIAAQLFLQVTDEILSVTWGQAHDHLRLYHESNRNGFHTEFSRRRVSSLGKEHDKNRRIFLEPCCKVWNLINAGLVDDDAAKVVLTPDLILTLLEVIEPLEEIIRSNYDRSMFDWARALYTKEELKSRGAHIHRASDEVKCAITGE